MARHPQSTRIDAPAGQESVACRACMLRRNPAFRPLSRGELTFVAGMRKGQISLRAGEQLVCSGDSNAFYTLYDGWAARIRNLTDGSRQILDVLLPGDLFGLSAAVLRTDGQATLALTDVTFCVLEAAQLHFLFSEYPMFAFSLFAARLQDQERADARLASIGQMAAAQRVAHLLLDLRQRLDRRGMCDGNSIPFPLQRTHIAEAVGLSRVHVMRALRKLRGNDLIAITGRTLTIPDVRKLARYCSYQASVLDRTCTIL